MRLAWVGAGGRRLGRSLGMHGEWARRARCERPLDAAPRPGSRRRLGSATGLGSRRPVSTTGSTDRRGRLARPRPGRRPGRRAPTGSGSVIRRDGGGESATDVRRQGRRSGRSEEVAGDVVGVTVAPGELHVDRDPTADQPDRSRSRSRSGRVGGGRTRGRSGPGDPAADVRLRGALLRTVLGTGGAWRATRFPGVGAPTAVAVPDGPARWSPMDMAPGRVGGNGVAAMTVTERSRGSKSPLDGLCTNVCAGCVHRWRSHPQPGGDRGRGR